MVYWLLFQKPGKGFRVAIPGVLQRPLARDQTAEDAEFTRTQSDPQMHVLVKALPFAPVHNAQRNMQSHEFFVRTGAGD